MRSSLRMSTAPLSLEASPPAGSSPAGLLGLGFLDVSPQEQQPAAAAPGALFARPSSDGAELGAAMSMQPEHVRPMPFQAPAEQLAPEAGVMLNPALESPIPVGQPLAPSPLAPSPLPPEQVPPAAALVVTVNPAAALAVTVNPAAQAIPVVQPCGHGRAGVAAAWAVGAPAAPAAPAAPTVAVARAAKGQGGRAEQKRAEQKRLPDPEVVQQVRAYMKEHELSQRTFSESCQISQTVICHWLAAKYKGDNAKVRAQCPDLVACGRTRASADDCPCGCGVGGRGAAELAWGAALCGGWRAVGCAVAALAQAKAEQLQRLRRGRQRGE